jgi:hypothetical protein
MGTGLPDGMPIFNPKIPIWVNFGGPWNGKYRYILCQLGIFDSHFVYLTYDHLIHFVVIWYIFTFLVCFTKINLATLKWANVAIAFSPIFPIFETLLAILLNKL